MKAHAQQNNAEDDFGSDCQIIQKEKVIKVRLHAEQTKAKRKENRLGADNEIIQDEQVSPPLLPVLCYYKIGYRQPLQ